MPDARREPRPPRADLGWHPCPHCRGWYRAELVAYGGIDWCSRYRHIRMAPSVYVSPLLMGRISDREILAKLHDNHRRMRAARASQPRASHAVESA
jgi:hypothetical protein